MASAAPRRHRKVRKPRVEEKLPEPRSLAEALEQSARTPPAKPEGLSVSIADLDAGQVIFERSAQTPETIASITKLFTTAAALHFLGPDYKFKTTFWRRGEVKEGMLLGSLLVVGGGDPNISGRFYNDDFNAVFDRWAQGLVQAGIRQVAGDLILNSSFFDGVSRHPDWPTGQEAKWYQAPISALAFNDNVVLVSIRPGVRPGKPAAVSIDPPTGVLHPVSSARTVSSGGAVRVAVARSAGSDNVTVSGTVPARPVWWSTPIAVDNAPEFFGAALRNRLKNSGIQLTGSVVEKATKPDASWALVAQTESDLLPTLAVVNKHSQGFYAEQVFKTIAAEKTGQGELAGGGHGREAVPGLSRARPGPLRPARRDWAVGDQPGGGGPRRFPEGDEPPSPVGGLEDHVGLLRRDGRHPPPSLPGPRAPGPDSRENRHNQRGFDPRGIRDGQVGKDLRVRDFAQRPNSLGRRQPHLPGPDPALADQVRVGRLEAGVALQKNLTPGPRVVVQ